MIDKPGTPLRFGKCCSPHNPAMKESYRLIRIFVELLPDSQGPQDFAQPLPQEHAGNVLHRELSEPEWIHQIFDQAPGSSFLPLPFDNSLNRKPERSTREEEFRFHG